MVNDLSFEKLHNNRKLFLKQNDNVGHKVIEGSNILLSAPHAVSQVRLGKNKVAEIGSITTALYLKNKLGCSLIAKTKNLNDDANFDMVSEYKDDIKKLIALNKVDYVIDFHGLAATRDLDVNIGTHLGKNIENNIEIFERLVRELEKNNFSVGIDQPFMAGSQTVSGDVKNTFARVWTIQIEINCGITNNKNNFVKYAKLLNILTNWIGSINK